MPSSTTGPSARGTSATSARASAGASSQPSQPAAASPGHSEASRAISLRVRSAGSCSVTLGRRPLPIACPRWSRSASRSCWRTSARPPRPAGAPRCPRRRRRPPRSSRMSARASSSVVVDRDDRRRVVAGGLDGRVRHRVDRVGADQLVDVQRVRVGRVLGRGRRPQRPLHVRALRRQRLPARAGEDALERLVGEARVGDGGLAGQVAAAELCSSAASILPSTRETKKLATEATRSIGSPAARALLERRARRPRRPARSARSRTAASR